MTLLRRLELKIQLPSFGTRSRAVSSIPPFFAFSTGIDRDTNYTLQHTTFRFRISCLPAAALTPYPTIPPHIPAHPLHSSYARLCSKRFQTRPTAPALRPILQMQAAQREAELLVAQLRAAASPQQQATAARKLVAFCAKQKYGKEWSDTGGRAGVPAALVLAAKIGDAALRH